MNRIFGRKKKEKDGASSRESTEFSENDFLSSLPAKANKRYSMAYSSYQQPESGSRNISGAEKYDDKGKAVDTPEFFVNTINVLPNIEILAQLCSTLQSKPSSWAKSLIDSNGIEALCNVLVFIEKNGQKDSDIILQSLAISCILSLLNSKYGIEKAIATPNSMIKIITTMDTPKADTRSSVFEILTAVCMVSEKGYQLILEAMTHFKQVRKERFRFTYLVESMKKDQSDKEYLTTCLTLINGIVNSSEEVDERIQLRGEFSRLGLDEIIRVNKKIQYEEAPDLLTQIDVYDDELRADQEELAERFADLEIDINNPKEIFKIIHNQTKDQPHHPFLSILQSLLSIPTDTESGMLSWFLVEKLIQQISLNKPMIGDEEGRVSLEDLLATTAPSVALQSEYKKNFEDLHKTKEQLKKATFDLNIANQELSCRSQESSVLKSNMFNTVKQKDIEISKLRGQVKRLDSNFFSPPPGAGSGSEDEKEKEKENTTNSTSSKPPASAKPPLLPKSNSAKSVLKKEKARSSDSLSNDLKHQVDSAQQTSTPPISSSPKETSPALTSTTPTIVPSPVAAAPPQEEAQVPPPPPVAAAPPPPPPPPMMGGPPPPPPPPMMGGGPPPPPPPPGGAPGGPPPPPGAGGFGLFNSNKPPANAPKFTVSKPSTKVKQFQWTKIPNKKLNDTIFTNMGNIKTDWLNPNEIENLFFAAESAPKKLDASDKKSTSSTKPGSVTVIDPKKSQNLAIYLSKFKCQIEDIKTALYTLDEEVFNIETLKQLEQYLPTDEDMEAIKDYLKNGELKMLTKAEQFLLEMESVSNLQERVKSFYLKIAFPDKLKEIKPDLELFTKTTKDIKSSKNFLKVIEVILIIGNFLNGGTARGDCLGFKLDALLKLTDTKTFNNKSNLLVYIISEIEQKFPEALKFMDDLSGVQECVKISLNTIQAELNILKKDLDVVTNGLGKMKRNKDESYFFSSMDDFIKDANIEIKIAFEQFQEAEKNFQQLASFFGEEPKMASEDFFSLMNRFIVTFDKCYKDFQRDKEAAERALKRDEAKQKKQQALKRMNGKLSQGKSTSGANPLSSSTSSMAEGMVDDIMQSVRDGDAFKQRRQRKATTETESTTESTSIITTPSGIEIDITPPKASRRGKKSSDTDKEKGKEKEKEKEKEESIGSGTVSKKDINVAAKALTIVMRSKQNYSRIDNFNFNE
ncbi:hypothetical protein DICPUDRAFT_148204 [Dictyostelium purpureum]|uniref:FH2 domain-containing protein n=1 Tax=Dictyostelium purpureum TaxID=5786 RepID=F0ZAI9_DICPU|nr:uncharacterized protein DICPUDRAFT_148204 [Dictyostelium purpureum]EGC39081.1 hypothetical protein DICPUDRAFT_148204 [Dictyostelium purpureum]|eukprot:XP_003284431.1 hypothetical protein DICPUDRAFT_148204 [Dictyostelium purpureum]